MNCENNRKRFFTSTWLKRGIYGNLCQIFLKMREFLDVRRVQERTRVLKGRTDIDQVRLWQG